jgi:protein-tyrosine phosphatase
MADHEAFHEALYQARVPVVVAAVPYAAGRADPPFMPLVDERDVVIEDGLRPGGHLTVVRVAGQEWSIVQAGVLGADVFEQLAVCRIVFVCTGNTCRSPMAQALCSKLLADRLGCSPAELPGRGFAISSAGLAAFPGEPASEEAVVVARDFGVDLSAHRSQLLTAQLLDQADHVFVMTQTHLDALGAVVAAQIGPQPRLLSPSGEDVLDPIGSTPDVYRLCAQHILKDLEEWLPGLLKE